MGLCEVSNRGQTESSAEQSCYQTEGESSRFVPQHTERKKRKKKGDILNSGAEAMRADLTAATK